MQTDLEEVAKTTFREGIEGRFVAIPMSINKAAGSISGLKTLETSVSLYPG